MFYKVLKSNISCTFNLGILKKQKILFPQILVVIQSTTILFPKITGTEVLRHSGTCKEVKKMPFFDKSQF